MAETTAWMEGMDDLLRDFARLGEAVKGQALKDAGMAMALPVVNGAKSLAPKRTRTLARSIHWEILEADNVHVVVGVGTDLEYAKIQEYGGTIVPKEKQFLAVPLTEGGRAIEGARNFEGLRVVMGKSGQSGVLVDKQGTAHYALVRSVTIPAQPYLRPGLDQNRGAARDEAAEVLKKKIQEAASG